jgi:hypothetical protein
VAAAVSRAARVNREYRQGETLKGTIAILSAGDNLMFIDDFNSPKAAVG